MNIVQLRNSVATYYRTNDPAHQLGHADDVYRLARLVIDKLGITIPNTHVAYAAYYHDIYSTDPSICLSDRRVHNVLAHDHIMNTPAIGDALGVDGSVIVARAILEHRASYKGAFYTPLSEVISTADRGLPDLDAMITRAITFRSTRADHTNLASDVMSHIVSKYGPHGYAKYPPMYRRVFGNGLRCLQLKISSMSVDDVTRLIQ